VIGQLKANDARSKKRPSAGFFVAENQGRRRRARDEGDHADAGEQQRVGLRLRNGRPGFDACRTSGIVSAAEAGERHGARGQQHVSRLTALAGESLGRAPETAACALAMPARPASAVAMMRRFMGSC